METSAHTRWGVVARMCQRPWVRVAVIIWAVFGAYDTFISQVLPSGAAEKFPRLYDLVVMTSGFLPWWGWLLVLAAIFVASSIEYAYCKGGGSRTEPTNDEDLFPEGSTQPLGLSIDFDGSELFNEISSPREYGEQLLCRIYRIGVKNETKTTLRNVRVIVKNMTLVTTGQIITHFLDDSLGAKNRGGISSDIVPGAMVYFDVLYARDSKVQHGPEFNFTIDDNQLALCIPGREPNAAIFKESYEITLQAQADDTLAVSRRFVTAIDDRGDVLFRLAGV